MTPEQHLKFQAESETKTEYHEGLVAKTLDMAGASSNQALLNANVTASLVNQLRGRACRADSADLKIWTHRRRRYLYPDQSVICGIPSARPEADAHAADNPKVLFEVLYPSSAGVDRGAKSTIYKHLEQLEEYVVLEQVEPSVDVHRRQGNGT